MAFQVKDGYGSVITIDSSVFGSTHRQIIGASIIGALTTTPSGNQSVSGTVNIAGNPSISGTVNTAQAGTVITSISGTVVVQSIVGTYAEDAAHATTNPGLFTLGVRNDAVASFVSADLEYTPRASDSAGRALTKPFAPEESRIEGYNSVVSTSVTTLVAAAGAGLRNYITDLWVANTGAATTLVTFRSGGGTSVLGYTIAPTGSGSNLPALVTPIRTLANETFDIQATTSTSVLYVTVKGFKAP